MNAAEAFRKNAEACSKMADKSPDPWDRANWMRLAESWTRLAKTSAKPGATGRPAAVAPAAPAPTPEAGARRKRRQKKSPGRRRAPRKA
jgi:hypothetical protein